jgi:cold shock CspA family protein/ribosome-associated translation inhibitor RaiA
MNEINREKGNKMQVPLEIFYKDINKTDSLDELINEKISRLEKMCNHITSCSIAIEKPNATIRQGNPYRVRITLKVPPGHEIAVSKEPGDNDKDDPLPAVIRNAFIAMEKQLKKLVQLQRDEVKKHPEQEVRAIVTRIYPEDGYGFIRTINGREIYFHKNSVLNQDFAKIQEGTGVRFFETEGEKGPQASTVQIID